MKSRKKVSRKKKASRRSRRARNKSKRGGMVGSARAIAGTLLYHEILPLIRAQQIIYNTGHDPQPDRGSITKANERFYQTFKDIPIDNGIKESIRNLREEIGKRKKKAKARKKQKQAQARGLMVVGKAYTPTSRYIASVTDVSSPKMNQMNLQQFVNPPFSSPNIERYPEYLPQTDTPAKPPTKSELDRHNQSEGDGDDNHNDDMSVSTPSKILFGIETPMSSPQVRSPPPPPPDQIRNQENRSPQLQLGPLSPDTTAITKKLSFTK
jgi:hypothetical protein